MLDSAEVGTGLGQVTQVTYDALKQAITDNEAKIKTVMPLTELQAIVDDLQAKRDAMAASAVMPATGKYYWIVSQGVGRFNAAIGASNNADGAALLQGAVIEVEACPTRLMRPPHKPITNTYGIWARTTTVAVSAQRGYGLLHER